MLTSGCFQVSHSEWEWNWKRLVISVEGRQMLLMQYSVDSWLSHTLKNTEILNGWSQAPINPIICFPLDSIPRVPSQIFDRKWTLKALNITFLVRRKLKYQMLKQWSWYDTVWFVWEGPRSQQARLCDLLLAFLLLLYVLIFHELSHGNLPSGL